MCEKPCSSGSPSRIVNCGARAEVLGATWSSTSSKSESSTSVLSVTSRGRGAEGDTDAFDAIGATRAIDAVGATDGGFRCGAFGRLTRITGNGGGSETFGDGTLAGRAFGEETLTGSETFDVGTLAGCGFADETLTSRSFAEGTLTACTCGGCVFTGCVFTGCVFAKRSERGVGLGTLAGRKLARSARGGVALPKTVAGRALVARDLCCVIGFSCVGHGLVWWLRPPTDAGPMPGATSAETPLDRGVIAETCCLQASLPRCGRISSAVGFPP